MSFSHYIRKGLARMDPEKLASEGDNSLATKLARWGCFYNSGVLYFLKQR